MAKSKKVFIATKNLKPQCVRAGQLPVMPPIGEDHLARISVRTRVVAVNTPNEDAALASKTWRDFLVSASDVEAAICHEGP